MLDVFDSLTSSLTSDAPGGGLDGPADDTIASLLRMLVGSSGRSMSTAACISVEGVDPNTLRQVVLGVEQLRRSLDATEAHALAELVRLEDTDRQDGAATSTWLASHASIPSGVARQRVAVANALEQRVPDPVGRALTEGRIGHDHARVIADAMNDRNHDDLAAEIDHHLASAENARAFHSWRRAFQARAALLDADGPFDPEAERARNRLRLSPSTEFMTVAGELVGDHALVVRDSLEAIADELFHQYTRDHSANPEIQVPTRTTLLALALEEVCRRAFERGADGGGSDRPRTQVHLVLHAQQGPDGALSIDPIAFDRDGCPWLLRDVATLICDASIVTTVLDSLGLPTDSGRSSRVPSAALRRAVEVRDGGCTHPGCERPPRHCDAHHVVPWEHGGPTVLHNLVLLCRRHHRLAHRHGWRLTLSDDGWTRWRSPSGIGRHGQRHQQRCGCVGSGCDPPDP